MSGSPPLAAYRKPFVPPSSKELPLYVKSIDYQGQDHAATAKRAIVVAVDDLPLQDEAAVHTIKLLAGPRWTPNPPKDAGVMDNEAWGNGYIKISSDTYPRAEMNLKWVSDALDRLVAEANVSAMKRHLRADADHVLHRNRNPNSRTFPLTCAMSMQRSARQREAIIAAIGLSTAFLWQTSRRSGSRPSL